MSWDVPSCDIPITGSSHVERVLEPRGSVIPWARSAECVVRPFSNTTIYQCLWKCASVKLFEQSETTCCQKSFSCCRRTCKLSGQDPMSTTPFGRVHSQDTRGNWVHWRENRKTNNALAGKPDRGHKRLGTINPIVIGSISNVWRRVFKLNEVNMDIQTYGLHTGPPSVLSLSIAATTILSRHASSSFHHRLQ